MNIANNPKRGEVYFIRIPAGTTVAHEIRYSRPGVIVSTDELNSDSYTVNVVFLSTAAAERHDIPADRHPLVTANKLSAAICEQVSTVDVSRLGARICRLTDEEMKSIDAGLADCLGLSSGEEAIDLWWGKRRRSHRRALRSGSGSLPRRPAPTVRWRASLRYTSASTLIFSTVLQKVHKTY